MEAKTDTNIETKSKDPSKHFFSQKLQNSNNRLVYNLPNKPVSEPAENIFNLVVIPEHIPVENIICDNKNTISKLNKSTAEAIKQESYYSQYCYNS